MLLVLQAPNGTLRRLADMRSKLIFAQSLWLTRDHPCCAIDREAPVAVMTGHAPPGPASIARFRPPAGRARPGAARGAGRGGLCALARRRPRPPRPGAELRELAAGDGGQGRAAHLA